MPGVVAAKQAAEMSRKSTPGITGINRPMNPRMRKPAAKTYKSKRFTIIEAIPSCD